MNKITDLKFKKGNVWVNVVKLLCDCAPALHFSELVKSYLNINEGTAGLGGLFSALITTYYGRSENFD